MYNYGRVLLTQRIYIGVFFCKHLGLQAHRFLKLLICMILRFESHRYGRVLSSFMLIMFHSVSEGFDRLYSEVFPFIFHLSSPDFRLESKVEGFTLIHQIKQNQITFFRLGSPKILPLRNA